jgi:hypothetical protein
MTRVLENPVLRVAREDYQPSMVAIDTEAIARCQPAGALKSIGATLRPDSVALALEGVPYFITMNILNFQFWDVTDSGEFVRYRHNDLEGALAMQAAFLAAWEVAARRAEQAGRANDIQVIATALKHLFGTETLTGVFGDIPAIGKRARLLLEVLQGFGEKLEDVSNIILENLRTRRTLGWEHAQLLAQAFPESYGDDYLKKAQLTLMFIAGQWNESHPGQPCALDVTAAADYQLPKILRSLSILRYSQPIAESVDNRQLIEPESIAERAIRAATVLACEQLAQHLNCTVPEVDFWLWVNRNQAKAAQFHLTRTTAY